MIEPLTLRAGFVFYARRIFVVLRGRYSEEKHEPNGAGDDAHHDRTQKRDEKYRFRLTKGAADIVVISGSYHIACQYGNAIQG